MTYGDHWNKDKCPACKKPLVYDIAADMYKFCDCLEKKQTAIPLAVDQVSIADTFENELEDLINKYSNQGVTVGTIAVALQNRIWNLYLNIHMPSIIEIVKKHIK